MKWYNTKENNKRYKFFPSLFDRLRNIFDFRARNKEETIYLKLKDLFLGC